ncbi:uncharacterized protein NPIL_154331 [Nephila pilipes]|uniref:Uncharacterized protein n=1 Tax=Nephila pilipes TaxID=299642 RepID=A0A8X6QL49_NEPPI|nr:uncharacterized protein NPIL_154331 [Nephila pilipes]
METLALKATLNNLLKMFAKVVLFCAALAAAQASLIAPVGLGAPVLAAGPLGYGKGLIASAPVIATVSSQKTAIDHIAPAAGIAVAAAPIALAGNGILGNGLAAHNGILSNGVIAGNGILANGVIAGNGILANGLAGHGIQAAPLAVGTGLLGASYGLGAGYGLGYGAAINAASTQKSVINHVAPVAPRVAVAAAPVAVASNGILANGLVAGHGIGAAPLAVGTGILGAPYGLAAGHGLGYGAAINAASTQKSVINHVAPVAPRVAVAAAPVAVASNGILANGLVGGYGIASNGVVAGNGILANGLVAGAPLGIAGHGIAAHPLSIGTRLHGSAVDLSLGKAIY